MQLLQQGFIEPLKAQLDGGGVAGAQLARMLALTAEPRALQLLMPMVQDAGADPDLRREALRAIAANRQGAGQLVSLAEQGAFDPSMEKTLLFALRTSPWQGLFKRAARLLPESASDAEKLPVADWMKLVGNAERGQPLFAGKATCATCHKAGELGKEIVGKEIVGKEIVGKDVGPALTEIGSKLSRTGLYEAILYPNVAISHNYETYLALTDAGTAVTGLLISETETTVTLKTDKGVLHELQRDELEQFEKTGVSLMPSGLHKLMTPQELADLTAYLQTLKQPPAEQQ